MHDANRLDARPGTPLPCKIRAHSGDAIDMHGQDNVRPRPQNDSAGLIASAQETHCPGPDKVRTSGTTPIYGSSRLSYELRCDIVLTCSFCSRYEEEKSDWRLMCGSFTLYDFDIAIPIIA